MTKTAVITGSSRGIGREIALAFAKNGYNVVINSRKSVNEGNKVAEECAKFGVRAIYIQADVSLQSGASELIIKAYKTFGRIDVLVNNAGTTQRKLFIDCNKADINDVLFGNLLCTIYPSQEAIKLMKDNGGSIINISSIQAKQKGSMESLYATSKAGILGLTRSLAAEYGMCGIRVNGILPGFIETDMTNGYSKQDKQDFCDITPLEKLGTPKDVAGLAVFLASENASFITGACVTVDGGVTIS